MTSAALAIATAANAPTMAPPPLSMWGIAGALFLTMGILAVLFRGSRRKRLRVPLLLLLGWAVATIFWSVSGVSSGLREWCEIVALVCLALAGVRLGWLLVVDWGLNQGASLGISRIARDLFQATLYIITAIAAARAAGADARALATTGGLVTAGLTFSLQQTLGDLVAGLLLQAEAPFKVGDWISYDDDVSHVGRVVEINWRATKIVTFDMVELTVPNSVLAKAAIVNFHEPALPTRRAIPFTTVVTVPPQTVKRVALDAIAGAEGVLDDPPPDVYMLSFADSGVLYELRYFVNDQSARERIRSRLHMRLWYALRRAGIELAFPRTDVALVDDKADRARAEEAEHAHRAELFRRIDFLGPLGDEERKRLAARARTLLFTAGETVFREGDRTTELYIVSKGQLAVFAQEGTQEIARFGAGDFFGEMALLTGEPRSATVRAIDDSVLCSVDKSTFEPILFGHKELFEQISQIVAQRQDEIARRRGESMAPGEDLKTRQLGLLSRMVRYFGGD